MSGNGTKPGRREFLAAGGAVAAGLLAERGRAQDTEKLPAADPDCRRCQGVGLVPLAAGKPYFFVERAGAFKPEEAVPGELCPLCRAVADEKALVEIAAEQHAAVLEKQQLWEERMEGGLLLVQTRHAAIHTQLRPAEARKVGQAVETFTLHVQKVTDSLVLTPTRPAGYEQMLLWGQPAWPKFRKAMEAIYSTEQLGDNWLPARDLASYDHYVIAHCYFTPQTARDIPPEYHAVKFAGTRQMHEATDWKAPLWLWEGFGSYGQHAVFGNSRVATIYAPDRGPDAALTLRDARRQAESNKDRPWAEMLVREIRDFEKPDYAQSLGMVAYLLGSDPGKFLGLVRLVKEGSECPAAVEEAYGKSVAELEGAYPKWLAKT